MAATTGPVMQPVLGEAPGQDAMAPPAGSALPAAMAAAEPGVEDVAGSEVLPTPVDAVGPVAAASSAEVFESG